MLLHRGVHPSTNQTIIPDAIFDDLTTSSVILSGRGTKHDSIIGYGLGWERGSRSGHEVWISTSSLYAQRNKPDYRLYFTTVVFRAF